MRLFVAIALPEEVRTEIARAFSPLRATRPPVSWVARENLHITIKFLGEVAPGQVPALSSALGFSVSPLSPFELVCEGAGAFPSTRAPRVLWAGFREPLELVGRLQDNIETGLSGAAFPRDEGKPFHPHVTTGRVRGAVPPGWGDAAVGPLAGRRFGAVPVSSVRLYESRLSPAGATYRVIAELPLAG